MLNLKVSALAALYQQRKRRTVIQDVFTAPNADRIYQCLKDEVKWGLAYNDASGPQFVEPSRLAEMTAEDMSRFAEFSKHTNLFNFDISVGQGCHGG